MRDIQQYCQNLGGVIANLQGLEFYIRCVLSELPDSPPHGLAEGENIFDCKVGHELLESPMTNFDALGALIAKFNLVAKTYGWDQLDTQLVQIRDALAHGRVAYPNDEGRFPHLMKFSKPRDGKVQVSFNAELSTDWFAQHIRLTQLAQDVVERASHDLEHRIKGGVS